MGTRTQFVQCLGFQRSDLTPDAKSIPKRTSQYIGCSYRGDHCEHQEVTVTKIQEQGFFLRLYHADWAFMTSGALASHDR